MKLNTGENTGENSKYKNNQSRESSEVYTTGLSSNHKRATRNKTWNRTLIFENLTWLTSNEATDYLRLPSVGALRVLVCERRIPFHKLGRSLRFKKTELDRLLDASRNGAY